MADEAAGTMTNGEGLTSPPEESPVSPPEEARDQSSDDATPTPKTAAKRARRRRFTTAYKLRILAEADRSKEPGEVGRLLQRENLYSSHLASWRKAARQGSLGARTARTKKPAAKRPTATQQPVAPAAKPDAVYREALRSANAELARHEERGEALKATVKALAGLVSADSPPRADRVKAPANRYESARSSGKGTPRVSPRTFTGMGPTPAYRHFIKMFGSDHGYTVPQIRDILVQGGVKSRTAKSLLTGIYRIIRLDRKKA